MACILICFQVLHKSVFAGLWLDPFGFPLFHAHSQDLLDYYDYSSWIFKANRRENKGSTMNFGLNIQNYDDSMVLSKP